MEVQSLGFGSRKVWTYVFRQKIHTLFYLIAHLCGVLAMGVVSAGADVLDQWTLRFQGPPPSQLKTHWDVAYGHGLFVAVGHNGGDFGSIYTSPDGVVWTARHRTGSSDFTLGELRKVVVGNGRFVAVGWSYCAYVSSDGTNWIGGLTGMGPVLTEGFRDVCYGQGQFVAVDGQTSISNVLTSVDGFVWRRQRTSVLGPSWTRIAFGNNRFVAVSQWTGVGSTRSIRSDNAVSWSSSIVPGAPQVTGLTWGNGLFVAVGANSTGGAGVALSSPDGDTWTQHDYGASNVLGQVECVNGLFIATGNGILLTSTNGMNWESRQSTNKISRFAMGNGTLVGISGEAGFAYWGPDLYQSDALLKLDILRANPAELSLSGIVGQTCRIEAAEDAGSTWTPLTEVPLATSPLVWTETNAPLPSKRLYRGVWTR